jgi:hypothetical protein
MADDINPTQLMLLAQQLKEAFDQDPQKHTELRVALHCAYYAAFHFTKSCLKHYVYRKNTPTHTDLYDYLRKQITQNVS